MVKVKLNLKGINAVMTSDGVQADLNARAHKIASAANGQSGLITYVAHSAKRHPWVARVRIGTTDYDSIRDNLKNNTLLKSIDAGRR